MNEEEALGDEIWWRVSFAASIVVHERGPFDHRIQSQARELKTASEIFALDKASDSTHYLWSILNLLKVFCLLYELV
jgi:hypothetical protein